MEIDLDDNIALIVGDDAEEVIRAQQELNQHRRKLIDAELSNSEIVGKRRKQLERELHELDEKHELEKFEKRKKEAKTLADLEEVEEEERRYKRKREDEKYQASLEAKRRDNDKVLAKNIQSTITSTINSLQSAMTSAAETYASYVDKIQVRLLGTNETYSSITRRLTGVFGASPIFKMTDVMDKVAAVVEKGITFNVEQRAAMSVLASKVAATFDAFDASLLRLIRIQQEDSTQARLGMESMLTEFLNKNFKDSSYLQGLSKTVSANLLEASSLLTKRDSTQLEFVIQKYLGAFSSVGVSDSLISALSQGIGYLASGNVSALSSNSPLEQLLVAAANRGGADYGEMLTDKVDVADVQKIMTGLYSLVTEIGNSNNTVALNQYAQVFGMTISDIQAMLNLSKDAISQIGDEVGQYGDYVQRVVDETSFQKLFQRTGGAVIGSNLYSNFLYQAGRKLGDNVLSYTGWQVGNLVSGLMSGLETGIDIQPFGVGTHMNFDVGTLAKAALVATGALSALPGLLSGAGSLKGVNLSALGEDDELKTNTIQRGDLLSFTEAGTKTSITTYSGDFSEGALAQSSNAITAEATAKHTDETYNEEKEKMEKMSQSMTDVGDNVKFIVQLLNENGIVIRGRAGYTAPVAFDSNHFNQLMNKTDPASPTIIGTTVL